VSTEVIPHDITLQCLHPVISRVKQDECRFPFDRVVYDQPVSNFEDTNRKQYPPRAMTVDVIFGGITKRWKIDCSKFTFVPGYETLAPVGDPVEENLVTVFYKDQRLHAVSIHLLPLLKCLNQSQD